LIVQDRFSNTDRLETSIEVNWSHLGITMLYFGHQILFCQKLDISQNQIASLMELRHLLLLKHLNASNNCLKGLQGLESLLHLQELDVRSNRLSTSNDFLPIQSLPLMSLRVEGNPLDPLEEKSVLAWFGQ
jgi:hypothetical protein